MMSFLHTTVGERGGVLCPNLCSKGFLTLVQEDFASALMAEIQTEGPFFEAPLYGSEEQSGRGRGISTFLTPSSVGSYLQDCLHLVWVSNWSLITPPVPP